MEFAFGRLAAQCGARLPLESAQSALADGLEQQEQPEQPHLAPHPPPNLGLGFRV